MRPCPNPSTTPTLIANTDSYLPNARFIPATRPGPPYSTRLHSGYGCGGLRWWMAASISLCPCGKVYEWPRPLHGVCIAQRLVQRLFAASMPQNVRRRHIADGTVRQGNAYHDPRAISRRPSSHPEYKNPVPKIRARHDPQDGNFGAVLPRCRIRAQLAFKTHCITACARHDAGPMMPLCRPLACRHLQSTRLL